MIGVVDTVVGMRQASALGRLRGRIVGLVPTMGALHAGHRALIDRARAECNTVVASLFVNPTQFNDPSDLAAYPRTFEADRRFCEEAEVDYLFAPTAEEMYPHPLETEVRLPRLAKGLCGAGRPGHFEGVATVCTKLFGIVQPDYAYFGEKDFQQLVLIRRMVDDLNLPLEIVGVGTVREPDGLALSSRNARLTPEERRAAAAICRGLKAAQSAAASGEADAATLIAAAREPIAAEPLLRIEYLEIVDPRTLDPIASADGEARIVAAVWAGDVRLIDNMPLA